MRKIILQIFLGSLAGVFVLVTFILCVGLSIFYFSGKYTVPIMMYHHVTNEEFEAEDVTPENFRRQMNFLKTHHYHVISMDQLVNEITSGKPLPPKSVVIAFDDGNQDNYTNALPILKEFRFPVIFFISPGFFSRTGFMDWKEIKELQAQEFFSFGSHGMTQAYLPGLSEDKLEYEILESKKILEKGLGVKIDYIAYPVGGFNNAIKALVEKAGYKAAVTTNRGYDRFDKDLYEINRIRFSNADHHDIILIAKLSGYYNRFRNLKSPY